ncbi:ATP-binding protein [Acinetobacter modestus]|uniref:AAA family ATPase n=1 Tax=Acinetobacter modestus TaxID=1776740 RepID=UPI00202EC63E|nr:AAA family ATPase [Acinetobacter modestus]MCM1960501.1 ATP-binding protein [Acinetobacter modestus]
MEWSGEFPIPNEEYISQFSDLDFYKTLIGSVGITETREVLKIFNDAGYMQNIEKIPKFQDLSNDIIFTNSLIRDTGAHKAYEEAWKLFEDRVENEIKDFVLNYLDKDNRVQSIKFNFFDNILPTDINVLIGSNGIGKSYTLKIITDYILKIGLGDIRELERKEILPFDMRPNFSNLILVSYSVFEDFYVDVLDKKVKNKDSYKYFGLRARRSKDDKLPEFHEIGIGKQIPRVDATKAVFKMIYENYQFGEQNWWVNKFLLAQETLKKAFQFECIGIEKNGVEIDGEYDSLEINNKKYILINEKLERSYDFSNSEFINNNCAIEFIKNNEILELSSGQKLFSYIVMNILGDIKKESLILIDEPELFLHPNLEIEFIGLLKSILQPFNSKAILATHSLSIVREVPSRCVHIYKENKEWGLQISNPPFQTFGADMQRISTYVFGDKSITKPFEEWLEAYFKTENANAEYLFEHLKGHINEEMIMDILRLEKKYGN